MNNSNEFPLNIFPGIASQPKIRNILVARMRDDSKGYPSVINRQYAKKLTGIPKRKLEMAKVDLEYFIEYKTRNGRMFDLLFALVALLLTVILLDIKTPLEIDLSTLEKIFITLVTSLPLAKIKIDLNSEIGSKNNALHVIKIALASLS